MYQKLFSEIVRQHSDIEFPEYPIVMSYDLYLFEKFINEEINED